MYAKNVVCLSSDLKWERQGNDLTMTDQTKTSLTDSRKYQFTWNVFRGRDLRSFGGGQQSGGDCVVVRMDYGGAWCQLAGAQADENLSSPCRRLQPWAQVISSSPE